MSNEKKFGRRDRSAFDADGSAPATKADIEELKRLILASRYDRVDAVSRSTYQIARSANV